MTAVLKKRVTKSRPIPVADFNTHIRRFTVAEYHKLADSGVLSPADRVELIHGMVVTKMSIKPTHRISVLKLYLCLSGLLKGTYYCLSQQPITLADSEPEPDFSASKLPEKKYLQRHPGPSDVALVVEVADTSLEFDRETKLDLYAQNKLPQYWIVNLVENVVEVYRKPRVGAKAGYKECHVYTTDDVIPLEVQGTEFGQIPVKELLP